MKVRSKNLRLKKKRRGCPANNKFLTGILGDTSSSSNVETSETTKTNNTFQAIENKSQSKIITNQLFDKSFEGSPTKKNRRITRSASRKLGLRKVKNPHTNYKLLDLSFLNDALKLVSTCSQCKKGTLQLFSKPKTQVGLFEEMTFQCTQCSSHAKKISVVFVKPQGKSHQKLVCIDNVSGQPKSQRLVLKAAAISQAVLI